MATLKRRLYRKNSSGTYDTVHMESSSDLIIRPSGRTVEQDLAAYLPQVQNNDNVPQSLGKLIIGTTKGFIRGKALSVEGHTHNYAASSHTHTTSSITSGSFSVSRGGTGRSTLTSGYFLRGNGTSAVTLSSIDQVKTALGISSSSYSIIFGSYVGDGRYGTDQYITIALEIVPYLILVKRLNATSYINSFSESFLWLYNETTLLMSSYGSISCELDQTTFKWSGSGQSTPSKFNASTVFNESGVTYQYIAFGT